MNYLLDTHTLLWFCAGSDNLSKSARNTIENLENDRYLSIASLWEISIKLSLGKLHLSQPLEHFISEQIKACSLKLLPIRPNHVYHVAELPFHHRDPFDRLLVAQCQLENLTLITADQRFNAYKINIAW